MDHHQPSRRAFLLASSALAFAGAASPGLAAPAGRVVAEPVPARHVALKPSIFQQAQAANRAYLVSLSADRLLHNFHQGAGLPVKAPVYGGWEAQRLPWRSTFSPSPSLTPVARSTNWRRALGRPLASRSQATQPDLRSVA